MIDWLTVVPPVALAAAGLALVIDDGAIGAYRRRAAEAMAWLSVMSAGLVVGILMLAGRSSLVITLSPWSDAVFSVDPGLDVDRIASVGVLGVCLLAVVSIWRAGRDPEHTKHLGGALGICAASVFFIAAARSPLGLVAAWLVLDAALFFGAGIGRRGLLASQLGLLLALAGLMDLPIDAVTVDPTALSGWSRSWFVAAATVRMGLYPLWWSVPRTADARLWRALATRLAPTVAGACLLLNVTPAAGDAEANMAGLAFGSLAVAFGAALTWGARRVGSTLDWTTVHLAGLVVVAACLPGSSGRLAAIILLASLAISGSALFLMQDLALPSGTWWARWVPLGTFGFPPGSAFVGRWLMLEAVSAQELWALWAVLALSPAPMLARWIAGHSHVRHAGAPGSRPWRWLASVVLLDVIVGSVGLWVLLSEALPERLELPASVPVDSWTVWLGLLLPLGLAWLVGASTPRRPAPDTPRHEATRVFRLTEIFDGFRKLFVQAGRLTHDRLGLAESRRAMAWTVLAGVTAGLAFLGPTSPAADVAPPALETTLSFGISVVAAGLLLLARAPALSLVGLLAGYGVLATELLFAGSDAAVPMSVLALIKLVAGIVVVAILTISWSQMETESRAAAAGRRLVALRRRGPSIDDRGLAAMGLALACLVALGISSVTVPEALSSSTLQVALVLVAGGVLTGIFAQSALRLTCGVLLAMCGFELIYAFLEPGLVIAAGLAVFQIAFAIVASAFVGNDDVSEPTS